ncbi:arylsulfatase B [Dermacentor silvarum]|uniref:arylsulfatase B n=1 Tax=Dermacentor silvarum TaxID=543639 RepID=UPI002100B190|nr:arylsulfatase B [Dermacentor silvarum]
MTGLYAIRTGLQGFAIHVADPWGLPSNVRLLPEYLRDIGYETHLIGKWSIGYYKTSLTPTCRGFDSFYGYYNGEEDYYTHSITHENHTGLDFWLNTEPLFAENGSYSTTLYTERAQYLIRNRNKSKWSIGYYKTSLTPTCRGFDSFYGYYNGEEDYYTHSITHENHTGLDFWLNTEPLFAENGSYSTTLYTERAQYLIRNRNKSKCVKCAFKNLTLLLFLPQPFFLMLSHQSPHGAGEPEPFQAPQENVDKFPYIGEKNRTIYAGMVDALDLSVGEVFKALSDAGMLDNTIVVFISDNGGTPWGTHSTRSFNWPLRGSKGTVWEGGTRVPAFVWSPLLAKTRRVSEQLMHITDWLPTLYSVAGGDMHTLGELDGIDMWRPLSEGTGSPRVEMLYNIIESRFLNNSALRSGRYKLVLDGTGFMNERYARPGGVRPSDDLDTLLTQSTAARVLRGFYKTEELRFPKDWRKRATLKCGSPEGGQFYANSTVHLFDIIEDPCELNNVAGLHPEVVSFLKTRIGAFEATTKPLQYEPKDPAGFPENHNGTWAPWVKTSCG